MDKLKRIHKNNLAPLRRRCEAADSAHRRKALGIAPPFNRGWFHYLTRFLTRW